MRRNAFTGQPVRYMGTKRAMAPIVRAAVDSLNTRGRVADLFAGMGSVSVAMSPRYPVLANDVSQFASFMAESQLLDCRSWSAKEAELATADGYREALSHLEGRFMRRLRHEEKGCRGSHEDLLRWMSEAPHAGTSRHYAMAARQAATSEGVGSTSRSGPRSHTMSLDRGRSSTSGAG